jgi:hypothetical protein
MGLSHAVIECEWELSVETYVTSDRLLDLQQLLQPSNRFFIVNYCNRTHKIRFRGKLADYQLMSDKIHHVAETLGGRPVRLSSARVATTEWTRV